MADQYVSVWNKNRQCVTDKAYSEYSSVVKDINKVGLSKLREYLTTKRSPVRNFDRDIQIIKYTLAHGPTAAGKRFKMHSSQPGAIVRKYHQYAKECLEAIERSKTEFVVTI